MRRFVIFSDFYTLPLNRLNLVQRRVIMVLSSMIETNGYEKNRSNDILSELQLLLDDVQVAGGFGSGGEHDPRGNFQEGIWSMNKVQGVGTVIAQSRVRVVLVRMVHAAVQSVDYAMQISTVLDAMLDRLLVKGFWGGEGHLDPRGDRRDHNLWSMACVEGVDKPEKIVQVTTESILADRLNVCQNKLRSGDRDGAFVDVLDAMLESSKHSGMLVQAHQATLQSMRALLSA